MRPMKTTVHATTAARTTSTRQATTVRAKRRTRLTARNTASPRLVTCAGSATISLRRHSPTVMTSHCLRHPWQNAGSDSIAAYRMYGDDTFYSDQYGLHYNGWAARDDRGLCPSGFALPVKATRICLPLAKPTCRRLGLGQRKLERKQRFGLHLDPVGGISYHGGYGAHLWSQSESNIYRNENWYVRREADNALSLSYQDLSPGYSIRCVSRWRGDGYRCVQLQYLGQHRQRLV